MNLSTMIDDSRTVVAVHWGEFFHRVGEEGVTKIVVYGEPGPHCFLPWIAVYRDGEVWKRLDAAGKEIVYSPPDAAGECSKESK